MKQYNFTRQGGHGSKSSVKGIILQPQIWAAYKVDQKRMSTGCGWCLLHIPSKLSAGEYKTLELCREYVKRCQSQFNNSLLDNPSLGKDYKTTSALKELRNSVILDDQKASAL